MKYREEQNFTVMKMLYTCISSRYAGVFLLFLLVASCDQSKKSDPTVENIDTLSVKKMGTDSNSNMPIKKPKGSTEKIPNPYDAEKN